MKDYYTFSSKGYLTTFSAFPSIFNGKTGFGNDIEKLIKGEYKDFDLPLRFDQNEGDRGKNFRDVLDTRYPPAYLISDRMKNLLEENLITGWRTYSIELFDQKKNQIFGYNGFSITGRAGVMDLTNQPIIEKPFYEGGPMGKFYNGGYFDINTWDGSDFFILENSYWVIVTKRAVDLMKKNKVTALEYQRLSDRAISYP